MSGLNLNKTLFITPAEFNKGKFTSTLSGVCSLKKAGRSSQSIYSTHSIGACTTGL